MAKAIALMVLLTFCLWLYMCGQVSKQYGPGSMPTVAAPAQASPARGLRDDTALLRGQLHTAEQKVALLEEHSDFITLTLAEANLTYSKRGSR